MITYRIGKTDTATAWNKNKHHQNNQRIKDTWTIYYLEQTFLQIRNRFFWIIKSCPNRCCDESLFEKVLQEWAQFSLLKWISAWEKDNTNFLSVKLDLLSGLLMTSEQGCSANVWLIAFSTYNIFFLCFCFCFRTYVSSRNYSQKKKQKKNKKKKRSDRDEQGQLTKTQQK